MTTLRPLLSLAAAGVLAAAALAPTSASRGPAITVYKSPTCGCCAKWVEHLRAAGFAVAVHDTGDVEAVKTARGVPPALASCHTAVAGGYVFEGHVPADLIARFLKEAPAAAGLAVPGMPVGSPGMEGPSPRRYGVVTFDSLGRTSVYATR
jgi:hypothetical protein